MQAWLEVAFHIAHRVLQAPVAAASTFSVHLQLWRVLPCLYCRANQQNRREVCKVPELLLHAIHTAAPAPAGFGFGGLGLGFRALGFLAFRVSGSGAHLR